MDETHFRDRLDRAMASGPSPPPLAPTLERGRRTLRRRRGMGTVALAVVAVVAVSVGTAVLPGGDSGAGPGPGPASDAVATAPAPPTPTPTPSPTSEPTQEAPGPEDRLLVHYEDGTFVLDPGVTVHQRVEDPFGLEAPATSVALDATADGERVWLTATHLPGDSPGAGYGTSTTAEPSAGWNSFEDWLADQVEAYGAGPGEWMSSPPGADEQLAFEGGRLVAISGEVQVVEQLAEPTLPASFAPRGSLTAAAIIEEDGKRSFLLARTLDGVFETIPGGAVRGRTLEQFVDHARGKYESGEGLR